jgi:hypothetical protein
VITVQHVSEAALRQPEPPQPGFAVDDPRPGAGRGPGAGQPGGARAPDDRIPRGKLLRRTQPFIAR